MNKQVTVSRKRSLIQHLLSLRESSVHIYFSRSQLKQEETLEGREELRNSINREPIYEWEGSQRDSLGTITYVTKVHLQHLPCQVLINNESQWRALLLPVEGKLARNTLQPVMCVSKLWGLYTSVFTWVMNPGDSSRFGIVQREGSEWGGVRVWGDDASDTVNIFILLLVCNSVCSFKCKWAKFRHRAPTNDTDTSSPGSHLA